VGVKIEQLKLGELKSSNYKTSEVKTKQLKLGGQQSSNCKIWGQNCIKLVKKKLIYLMR
jgi:hypothetical protein